eukprot:gnl/Chilomastix_caulleri/857.p1 GENE.gnl/Chilomastix_caulleri/857~~gnl/Chilomastix_caulleri/857.p1  ORF type:complete len:144 (+),score=55.17 gnl/Chilomastix_caulleri/857:37-468(+)
MLPSQGVQPPVMPQMSAAQQEKAAAVARAEEQKQAILRQILSAEAAERLHRIKLVNSSKADKLADALIQAAKAGQLKPPIEEEQLKYFLEQMTEAETATEISSVTYGLHHIDDQTDKKRIIIGHDLALGDADLDSDSDVNMDF